MGIQYYGEVKTRDDSYAAGLHSTNSRLKGARWLISKETENELADDLTCLPDRRILQLSLEDFKPELVLTTMRI